LGVTRDRVFGPVMTVGLGGVLTELYQDISRRLLPIDRTLALAMIEEVKGAALLRGFRGQPPVDVAALLEMMVALSQTYLRHGAQLDEVELNPVLVRPKGCVAVDCLITLRAV
jgi:acyl-CoA synthetase (NDP forming)